MDQLASPASWVRELIGTARGWQDGAFPPPTELDQVTQQLRLLLDLLLTEAEARGAKLIQGSPARRALAVVVTEARQVISDGPGPGLERPSSVRPVAGASRSAASAGAGWEAI